MPVHRQDTRTGMPSSSGQSAGPVVRSGSRKLRVETSIAARASGPVSYRIVSYRIVSYRIVSYRIVSYRIVSYRIVSYRIVSYVQNICEYGPRICLHAGFRADERSAKCRMLAPGDLNRFVAKIDRGLRNAHSSGVNLN